VPCEVAITRDFMRKWERWWMNVPESYMLVEVQRTHPIRSLMAEEAKIGESVLDVACGQCISYPFFKIAGLKYVGLDFTKKFIDASREIYPEIELHEASVLDIPFPDASFDTVCCKDLLEHLDPEDVSIAIREMWRVTKLKLMIAFFIPPWDNPTAIQLIDTSYGPGYHNQYNKHEIMTIIKDLKDLDEVDIQWVRSDAAIKFRPPPGEKPYTHAPLYIITKKTS
jgi:ubiquinone/menaquinone biosynthesis C-methylase UbiE